MGKKRATAKKSKKSQTTRSVDKVWRELAWRSLPAAEEGTQGRDGHLFSSSSHHLGCCRSPHPALPSENDPPANLICLSACLICLTFDTNETKIKTKQRFQPKVTDGGVNPIGLTSNESRRSGSPKQWTRECLCLPTMTKAVSQDGLVCLQRVQLLK